MATTIINWVAFSVLLVGGVVGIWRLPSYWTGRWTGRLRQPDAAPAWWPWGDASWRGCRRCYPVSVFSSLLLAIVLIVMEFGPDEDGAWPGALASVWLLATIVLVGGVLLVNRPKRVVAPRYRSEPGMIAEWRSGRRRHLDMTL